MDRVDDFTDLMERARSGDPAAIRDFLDRFEQEVRSMVRVRLPRKLRPRFDSADFVQAVWKSFFSDLNEKPCVFADADHLKGFLAGVVRNKVQEQHRRLTRTEKYDMSREEQLYIRRGDREIVREVASSDPTPSENMQAADRLEQLTAGCSQREIDVLTLRRHGLTHVEIAKRIGMDESSVRRILKVFQARLEGPR
jgi:RNA polymerase sigma factor (sigma-70 family)